MDERFFFNPYGFYPPFGGGNLPPNMTPPPNILSQANTEITAKDFYENQYYYYRYLNEYINYQMKYAEFNKHINKPNFQQPSQKSI